MITQLITILLFFGLIYGMYGNMARIIVKWSKKPIKNAKGKQVQPKISMKETILCFIPFVQVCMVRKALYRTATPWNILCGISAFLIIARLVNLFIPINSYVMFYTIIMIYVGIIMHAVIYGFVTAAVAKLYGFSWWIIIGCAILPYWFSYFMRSAIPVKMMDLQKEATFSGKSGGARIESRSSK